MLAHKQAWEESSEACLSVDVFPKRPGGILNIVNLPILNNLMSHIRNQHDMTCGRMKVCLSVLTELPRLHGIG